MAARSELNTLLINAPRQPHLCRELDNTIDRHDRHLFDAVGNLTNINYPASTDIALKYDPLNRLTNMVDVVGTTAFSWLAGGQLFTEDGPWASDTVTNSYTKRLRTGLGLAQPSGYWTNGYKYDLARRLTNIASIAGSFSYAYEPGASPLVRKLTLPNTSYITNTYDAVARMSSTTLKHSSHTTLNSHGYTYNAGHQRTQQTFNAGSTYTYSYDPIGQLKVADSATASEDRGYAYDPAWHLSYRTNNTTLQTFTVNGKNELTGSPSPYGATSYDDNGNLILSHNEGRFYEYDDENQLVAVQRTAGLHRYKTTFAYDGKLRLRLLREYRWEASGGEEESLIQENGAGPLADPPGEGSWVLLSETRYLYDGMLVIQERDGNNTPTVTYTRGNDLSGSREGAGGIGGLLARSHGYSAGTWNTHNYYHADGNGNVTYLVDASQALAASYRYDPFGNTISSSGSLASANTYRFSSKMIHVNTGLYYYGYRWYAPDIQRWLTGDPIQEWGGINLFEFVLNDPVSATDPMGLIAEIFWPPIPRGNCGPASIAKCKSICEARGLFLKACYSRTDVIILERTREYIKYKRITTVTCECVEPRTCPPPSGGGPGRGRNDPPLLPPSGRDYPPPWLN